MKSNNGLEGVKDNNYHIDELFESLETKYPLINVISRVKINKKYNDKIRILKEKLNEIKKQDKPSLEQLSKICNDLRKSGFKFGTVSSKEAFQHLIESKIQKLKQLKNDQLNSLSFKQEYNVEFIKKLYRHFYNECKIRDEKEGNPLEQTSERAYKMLLLFGDLTNSKENIVFSKQLFKNLDTFIKNHAGALSKPIHDIFFRNFLGEITHVDFDLDGWRTLIKKVGLIGIKALESAIKIQQLMNEVPFDSIELKNALSQLSYKRHKENPILSNICSYYKVPENIFDRILDLKIPFKKQDNLPNITISGEEIGSKGYYFIRLPVGDYRGFILGYITNCCQSIGSHGEPCIIDGMTLKHNGFYLLLKATSKNFNVNNINWENLEETSKILGQGYLWKSEHGNLVFDSWENIRANDNAKTIHFLKKFAKAAIAKDSSISRVTIGLGGNTPRDEFTKTLYAESMLEGSFYGDALEQGIIFENTKLKALVEELIKHISPYNLPTEQFVSIIQAKSFLESITKDLELAHKVLNSYKGKTEVFQLLTSYHGFKDLNNITIQNIANYNSCDIELNFDIKEALKIGIKFSDLIKINSDVRKEFVSKWVREAYAIGKINITDLLELNSDKIKHFLSWPAVEGYKAGFFKIDDLKDLDEEEISTLTSYEAIEAYKQGVQFKLLIGLEKNKTKLLISNYAIEVYKTGGKIEDLKDIEIEKLKLLISYEAIKAYETGKVKVEDLKNLEINIIPHLISHSAIEVYEAGIFKISDLKDLNGKRISLIIATCYCSREMDFNWLKTVEIEKLERLTSQEAQRAYQYSQGTINFDDLKDEDIDKIDLLISWEATQLYLNGVTTVNDLKKLNTDQIKLFTNKEIIPLYREGIVKLDELITAANIRQIKLTFLKQVAIKLCQEQLNISESIEETILELLISTNAVQAYKIKAIKVSDLQNFDVEKIKLLTSHNAIHAYQYSMIKFSDLESLDKEKLEFLLSAQCFNKTGLIKIADLNDLAIDKITFLLKTFFAEIYQANIVEFCNLNTSGDLYQLKYSFLQQLVAGLYNEELELINNLEDEKLDLLIFILINEVLNNKEANKVIDYFKFNELKDLEIEKFKLLTSYNAREFYKKSTIRIENIKGLEIEKIKFLLSYEAQRVYETEALKIHNLISLNIEKIQFLISENLYRAYGYKVIKVAALDLTLNIDQIRLNILKQIANILCEESIDSCINIDETRFNLLISERAIKSYQSGAIKVSNMMGLEIKEIEHLISWDLLEIYKFGGIKATELIELDSEKIKLLISWQARKAYKTGIVKVNDLVGLELVKISFLISHEAIAAYNTGMVQVNDLRGIEIETIKSLISTKALELYKTEALTINDLKKLNHKAIFYFTSWLGQLVFKASTAKFIDLIGLDEDKIRLLLSFEAKQVYQAGIKFTDLKDVEVEKLKLFLSQPALEGYITKTIHPNNLKELAISKIKILISSMAIKSYVNETVTLDHLKDLDEDKITLLISWFSKLDKSFGIKATDLNVKSTNSELKLSFLQQITIKLCHEYIDRIKPIKEENLDILISSEARDAYRSKTVKVSDLIDLEIEKISMLISAPAVTAYEAGLTKIADIKNLNVEQINKLICWKAIEEGNINLNKKLTDSNNNSFLLPKLNENRDNEKSSKLVTLDDKYHVTFTTCKIIPISQALRSPDFILTGNNYFSWLPKDVIVRILMFLPKASIFHSNTLYSLLDKLTVNKLVTWIDKESLLHTPEQISFVQKFLQGNEFELTNGLQ